MEATTLAELGTTLDHETFRTAVAAASESDLDELLTGPRRREVLEEIFRRMPDRLDTERAQGVDAVVHWHIQGGPNGSEDVYEVVLRDGTCEVRRPPSEPPRLVLSIRPGAFVRLVAAATTGMRLMLTRRLRVQGDLQFAMRLESYFHAG